MIQVWLKPFFFGEEGLEQKIISYAMKPIYEEGLEQN